MRVKGCFHGHPNAAFVRSTKVQAFRCDRNICDRRGGIVLGACPHLNHRYPEEDVTKVGGVKQSATVIS